jgi:hypothetical protein
VTWPAFLMWIVLLSAAASRGPALLYMLPISCAFETLQMLPAGVAGDTNLLPQTACAGLLIVKVLAQPGNVVRVIASALDVRAVGLLTAFLAYSIPTAFILPILFANRAEVFNLGAQREWVHLTTGNFTQSAYMTLSVATAMVFSILATVEARQHFLMAVLLGGIAAVVTGAVDLAAFTAGQQWILEPFRTVSYTLLTSDQTLGSKRVVGLMSEASAYGSLCVVWLAALIFLRPCFSPSLRTSLVPLTAFGLFVMALLSTSSSAYVALGALAVAFVLNWLIRYFSKAALSRSSLGLEFWVVVAGLLVMAALVTLTPGLLTPAQDMFDATLVQKTSSSSYLERTSWTSAGWHAFINSNYLGVGLGSIRTSNWFVNIVGSTGLFGAVLLFGFMLLSLLWVAPGASAVDREWQRGLRFMLFPIIALSYGVGTTPDFGPVTAVIYGLLAAIRSRSYPTLERNRKLQGMSRKQI